MKSATLEGARSKAETIAKQSTEEYKNPYGEIVVWQFKEVLDAKELLDETIADGVEVYYNFVEKAEVDHLRRMLQPFQT